MVSARSLFKFDRRLSKAKGADQGYCNSGIFLVKHISTGKKCIEKRISIRNIQHGHGDREISTMEQCSHSNIIAFIAADLDYSSYGYGSIFMERCELGALDTIIDRFRELQMKIPEAFLWKVLWEMSLALCYLQNGVDGENEARMGLPVKPSNRHSWEFIAHRDVKPANIFLTWAQSEKDSYGNFPTVVLADFGLGIRRRDMSRHDVVGGGCGTPAFMPLNENWRSSRDVYALGLTIYCMAQRKSNPGREHSREMRSRPLTGTSYSESLGYVLKRTLMDDRPEAAELPKTVYRGRKLARERGYISSSDKLLPWAFDI